MLGNLSITVGKPLVAFAAAAGPPPARPAQHRSLAGLGTVRRTWRSAPRSAVVTLIVLALAELQAVRRSDRLTTMFLIDASQSVRASCGSRRLSTSPRPRRSTARTT